MKITHKKSINASSLPKYGGAFDIDPSMFFTREDLDELNERVIDHVSETFSGNYRIENSYIGGPDNKTVHVEVEDLDDGVVHYADAHIDMRKIKRPSDLRDKYGLALASQIIEGIKEYHDVDIESAQDLTASDPEQSAVEGGLFGLGKKKSKQEMSPQDKMQAYLDKVNQQGDELDKLQQKALAKYGKNIGASIECATKTDTVNEVILQLDKEIEDAVFEQMSQPMRYGSCDSEEEIRSYFVVETDPEYMYKGEAFIKVEVRAELSYDSMFDMLKELDSIVSKYDSDAYFDMEAPGIGVALLDYAKVEVSSCSSVEGSDMLPGPGDYDPPEGPELTEHDDYQEEIILELDADILIDDDGNWDYVDDSCMWASADDKRSADWYSDEYKGVYLVDHIGAVEKTDDLLMTLIPDAPGKHHISGEVHLFFDLSNINSWVASSGVDEDGEAWYEDEYDTDSIDTEFNFKKSYIKDFKITTYHV